MQLPLQAALLVGAVRLAPELPMGQLLVFALAVGTVTGGMGITIAHELGHRASRLDRAIARALLVERGLRPLLRRARARPSRAGRDAGRSRDARRAACRCIDSSCGR
ncbi:MAG: hypothetical protein MZW92_04140 [Comamonadaceae bacterium]|nr:hypothetical protein [Comamonadaceae bacterium]